jgi:hypothetical protein
MNATITEEQETWKVRVAEEAPPGSIVEPLAAFLRSLARQLAEDAEGGVE